jgi:hypothetical protein
MRDALHNLGFIRLSADNIGKFSSALRQQRAVELLFSKFRFNSSWNAKISRQMRSGMRFF